MINIKEIEKQIKGEVADLVCQKYNVTADEVSVTFKGDGDLKVTITPKKFIEDFLKAKVEIVKEDN